MMKMLAEKNLLMAILLGSSPFIYAAESQPLLLKMDDINYSIEQIKQNNPLYEKSYKNLITKADKALKKPLYSVMDKSLLAASGDKHDYYSFPPYWWPDPSKKDGMPYLRKDGETNPAANSDATDKKRMNNFSEDVYYLALAYSFTGKPEYADKAREQLVNWFVNPNTRMNPNLQYAQAIPGINEGRGIGLIDSRALVDVIDAVELIRPANVLTEADYQAIKLWYKNFYQWMTTSQNGFEEDNWHNNHGTYFDMQAASFALFSDQKAAAQKRLEITQLRRIPSHFDIQGRQNAELERTRPWHYSNFHLEAYNKLGRLGEVANKDIWNFSLDEHSLKKGYQYVAGFINTDQAWPYKDLDGVQDKKALVNMMTAARAYPTDPDFQQKAQYLMAKYPDAVEILLYPITQPLIAKK
ncbi:Alginate lyase [Yersinia enterocolitica]|uniref:Alginate lyase n=4 Tax=Yersinia enterocolitica TaxID=630 RepID=A0A0H5GYY9_YEREN|nr:Alginate lyase [Yersinia enterocolitica]CFV20244.1 Alginate lyase [Yersinia enterocolitica]CFW57001.1 Alginate lyase [Yersinia enterocolitica]CNB31919.1 Alginate lyase [Yersinia enterocolitica]CNB40091.1 Alginate lyase [Yersinia enterocolitica]